MFNRFRNWWSRDRGQDHRDAEGVTSGILQRPTRDLDLSPSSKEWQDSGAHVEKIYIYPMKSGRGISFKTANCGPHGLWRSDVFDRMFMIVEYFPERRKQRPRFVSARVYHKLVLLEADVFRDDNGVRYLSLAAPESLNMRKLKVKLPKHLQHLTFTSIFFQECAGYDLGDEANDWITKYIKSYHNTSKEFKILYQPYTPGKREENHYAKKIVDETIPQTKPDDIPLFSDGYPYMLMAQKSLDEVNKRLKDRRVDLQVEERRFRPNIFLSSTKAPFVEDEWLYLKIGGAVFRNAKLCTRCVFTTVDPKTGEARRDREPLKTLRTFRISKDQRERNKYGPTPFLGINLALENFDKDSKVVINKGDKVFFIKRDK